MFTFNLASVFKLAKINQLYIFMEFQLHCYRFAKLEG